MKQYVFYTTEGYTYSPNNEEIENCQILAFGISNSYENAIASFNKEYAHLVSLGFSLEKIICKELV